MKFLNISLALLMCLTLSYAHASKYGPKVTPLSKNYEVLKINKNTDSFWKIIPYYRSQQTDASCSAASVTMIMNALIPSYTLDSKTQLLTEASVLNLSSSKEWKIRAAQGGDGMNLEPLAYEVATVLKKLKLKNYTSGFHELKTTEDKAFFIKALERVANGDGWIIANYDQGMLMKEGSYPHFSPIGAYDKTSNQVLVLDVDGAWYEPYWVPTEIFIKSMNTVDQETKTYRGFIWVFRNSL